MKEFVEFVESRIEPTDAKEDVKKEESNKKGTHKRKSKDPSDRKPKKKKSRKHQFYCKQHGYNNTHTTEDCRYLHQKNNKDQTSANSMGHKSYVSKEKVHAILQDVAEASAKAAIKKATTAWRKRKHEDNHAIEAVNSAIHRLKLDREENLASDTSEFSS